MQKLVSIKSEPRAKQFVINVKSQNKYSGIGRQEINLQLCMPARRIFIVTEKMALAAFLKELWLAAICNSSSRRFDVLLWPQQTCTHTEIKTVRISLYEGISCLCAIQIDLGAPWFHSPALSALTKPALMHGRVPTAKNSLPWSERCRDRESLLEIQALARLPHRMGRRLQL